MFLGSFSVLRLHTGLMPKPPCSVSFDRGGEAHNWEVLEWNNFPPYCCFTSSSLFAVCSLCGLWCKRGGCACSLRLGGCQTAQNLLDTSGAHCPLWGHSCNTARGQSCAPSWGQCLARFSRAALGEEIKNQTSLWGNEKQVMKNELELRGGLLLPAPRRIAVLSSANNSRKRQSPNVRGYLHSAPQKPPSIVADQLNSWTGGTGKVWCKACACAQQICWCWCFHLPFATGAGVERKIWESWSAAGWSWAGSSSGIIDIEHN